MRESGVLLPISALPSKYGIGCFSKEAYQFVDKLKAAGQKKWQILPLGQTSYGDSPYQSFSTFAGNPYFIDLEALISEGLLTEAECMSYDFGDKEDLVDYEKMYQARFKVLRSAFVRFSPERQEGYFEFIQQNGYWLEDYCLFMALKNERDGKSWSEWEEPLRDRHPGALMEAREKLAEEIRFYQFQQFYFAKQWKALHHYANENGIQIIGDIPIYVAFDSADTWARPLLFQFTENNEPIAVAGCPPDGFSATGQLWGNPLYSWQYHKETGYTWWLQRIEYCFHLYDVVRVDHFRGFDEYYSIPFGDETAQFGHWEKGPGLEFFHAVEEKLGKVNIIAEDLGYMTDSVRKLVADTKYPNMKVLMFAFDDSENSEHLPHNYEKNCVVYTGTHDNDTLMGWYETMNDHDKKFAKEYMNVTDEKAREIHWDFIRLAMASVANLCVVPMQDYLGLTGEARMNFPSTLGGNWEWRLKPDQFEEQLVGKIWLMTKLYSRL